MNLGTHGHGSFLKHLRGFIERLGKKCVPMPPLCVDWLSFTAPSRFRAAITEYRSTHASQEKKLYLKRLKVWRQKRRSRLNAIIHEENDIKAAAEDEEGIGTVVSIATLTVYTQLDEKEGPESEQCGHSTSRRTIDMTLTAPNKNRT